MSIKGFLFVLPVLLLITEGKVNEFFVFGPSSPLSKKKIPQTFRFTFVSLTMREFV